MSLQIASYRGISGVSDAIKLLTYSVYSHSAALYSKDMEVDVDGKIHYIHAGSVVEAWAGGVRLAGSLSENHTTQTKVDIFEMKTPLTPQQEQRIAAFLIRNIGKKYAYLNIPRFIPIVRLLIPKPPKYSYQRTHVFCSELVLEAWHEGGVPLLERCNYWEVPPRDPPRSPLVYLLRSDKTSRVGEVALGPLAPGLLPQFGLPFLGYDFLHGLGEHSGDDESASARALHSDGQSVEQVG